MYNNFVSVFMYYFVLCGKISNGTRYMRVRYGHLGRNWHWNVTRTWCMRSERMGFYLFGYRKKSTLISMLIGISKHKRRSMRPHKRTMCKGGGQGPEKNTSGSMIHWVGKTILLFLSMILVLVISYNLLHLIFDVLLHICMSLFV